MKTIHRLSALACVLTTVLAVGCAAPQADDGDQNQDALSGQQVAAQRKFKTFLIDNHVGDAAAKFGIARWEVYARGDKSNVESTLFIAMDSRGEAKYSIEIARDLKTSQMAGLALEWKADKATPLNMTGKNAALAKALNIDIATMADRLSKVEEEPSSGISTGCKLKVAAVAAATLVLAVAGGAEIAGIAIGTTTLASWLGLTSVGGFILGAAELRASVYLLTKEFSC